MVLPYLDWHRKSVDADTATESMITDSVLDIYRVHTQRMDTNGAKSWIFTCDFKPLDTPIDYSCLMRGHLAV
jgi:hypothetical protein